MPQDAEGVLPEHSPQASFVEMISGWSGGGELCMLVPGSSYGVVGLQKEEQGAGAGAGWNGSMDGGDRADVKFHEPLVSQNEPRSPGKPFLMQWMTPFSGRCDGGLGTDEVNAKRDRGVTRSAAFAEGSSSSFESAWRRAALCNFPASTMLTQRWLPSALVNCGAGPACVAVSRYG